MSEIYFQLSQDVVQSLVGYMRCNSMIINSCFLNKILLHTMVRIQLSMDSVPSEMQVDLFQLSCESIFKELYCVVKDVEAIIRSCGKTKDWLELAIKLVNSIELCVEVPFKVQCYQAIILNVVNLRTSSDSWTRHQKKYIC